MLPLKMPRKKIRAVASYRPVSLTFCVAKTMKCMIHNGLCYLAETRAWVKIKFCELHRKLATTTTPQNRCEPRLEYKLTENMAGWYRWNRGQYYFRCFSYFISKIWGPLYQTTLKSQCLQMTSPCPADIITSWPPKLPCKTPSHASQSGAGITRWSSTQRSVTWRSLQVTCTRPDGSRQSTRKAGHFTLPLCQSSWVTLDRTLSFWQHIANITAKAAGRYCVFTSLPPKQERPTY